MSTIEEKFERFAQLALSDAAAKRDNVLEQLDEYKSEKISEAENQCLENSYKIVRKGVADAKKKAGSIVSQEPSECKKKLFEYRESLIDELFNELNKKISEFKNTAEYSKFLINSVSDAVKNSGEGDKCIFIDKSDEKFADALKQQFACTVEYRADIIGGCIVENLSTKKIYNNSISEKISELRANFLEESKFSIY